MTLVMPHERFFVLPNAFASSTVQELVEGKEIQAFRVGGFDHPLYGNVDVTPNLLMEFKGNYDGNVYGQDIPINYEHFGMDTAKGLKAAGWLKGVKSANDGMYWTVSFTEEAAQEIVDGAWKYFSPEYYDEWKDPATGTTHKNVIVGGALTNRPFFKGMVPLNFSEVLDEVADWEHGEPGENSPRTDAPESPQEDGQGTRGPSPPVVPPLQEDSMEEFLKALRAKLGLDEETKEDDILIAASELVAEVTPIREATAKAAQHMTFAEQYPAEFARMQKLEESHRETTARTFAERYANKRLVEGEGDEAKTTAFGFSSLTVDNIEKMHLAFSEGKLTQAEIEAVLESLLNTGLVDYSERGTAVTSEETGDPVKAFAEKIASITTEDKIPYGDAVRVAGERYPELAKAYHETYTHRR